ncbi:MAG: high-affinity branched-chain amino acid ABC transporter permease LivM [Alphaproteobacteria bacterium]|jgi:branched-chain amino acid transport system permease protein|nr:high-affinity branched-chain amino acid ABC transporter permease LivM [Alphaproteobacteria bacterium]
MNVPASSTGPASGAAAGAAEGPAGPAPPAGTGLFRAIAREVLLAGLLAFGLFITVVGIQTVESAGRLIIEFRFADVAVAVALVMLGRLGGALIAAGYPLPVMVGGGLIAAIGIVVPFPSLVLKIACLIGAILLALYAAFRTRVPPTILFGLVGGALILALALNLLTDVSGVLDIVLIWYGGLTLGVSLVSRPALAERGPSLFGMPLWIPAVLAAGAVALAIVVSQLATDREPVVIETRDGPMAVLPMEPTADAVGQYVDVPLAGGGTTELYAFQRPPEGVRTARIETPDGDAYSVALAELWFIDSNTVGLFVLFYVFVVIAVVIAYRFRNLIAVSDMPDAATAMDQASLKVQETTRYIAFGGLAFAILLPFIFNDRSSVDLATLVLTYIMLAWGLNIVVGLAGLLDLGFVAFYAVGAYSYALLAVNFDLSFWACLPLAGAFAALAGLILGFPVLRLRGDYFAIVTLGFGEIIRIILLNWYTFTGGPDGIIGIPRPSFFGIADFTRRPDEGELAFHTLFGLEYDSLHRIIFLYYLILALALLVCLVSIRLRNLPLGRAWEALREDDTACQALGMNRRNAKLAAFTISAMFGGFAGSFFATRQGFISPESFTFLESAIILMIVVLGGLGSLAGCVLAALLVIGLPEFFRELEQYRMLLFGAAMVAIMRWRPRGLLSHRDPSVRFFDPKRQRRRGATAAKGEAPAGAAAAGESPAATRPATTGVGTAP